MRAVEIFIEGISYAKIYKHNNEFYTPERMREKLEAFNQEFTEERGEEADYKFAQLIKQSNTIFKEDLKVEEKFEGWGVLQYEEFCNSSHRYILHLDGTVSYENLENL